MGSINKKNRNLSKFQEFGMNLMDNINSSNKSKIEYETPLLDNICMYSQASNNINSLDFIIMFKQIKPLIQQNLNQVDIDIQPILSWIEKWKTCFHEQL